MTAGADDPLNISLQPRATGVRISSPALGEATVDDVRWFELDVTASQVHLRHRKRPLFEPLDFEGQVQLSLSPAWFDDASTATAGTCRSPASAHDDKEARELALTVIHRLDSNISGWRTSPGDERARPIEVFGYRRAGHAARRRREGIDLLGFLSEGWQRRIDAARWWYALADGTPVAEASLDEYGRKGGLIAYLHDHRSRSTRSSEAGGGAAPVSGPPLYEGQRAGWLAALRNVDTLLHQLATVAYVDAQNGVPTSLAAERACAGALGNELRALWHPSFGLHVDCVAVLARGLFRFRYSDVAYPARGPLVLAELRRLLADAGIASGPVVIS